MSFKDSTIVDKRGNTDHWKCRGCTPKNDKHGVNEYGDPCKYKDKPLMTEREDPANNYACSPVFCKKCGCHYTSGCKEHTNSGDQVRIAKPIA